MAHDGCASSETTALGDLPSTAVAHLFKDTAAEAALRECVVSLPSSSFLLQRAFSPCRGLLKVPIVINLDEVFLCSHGQNFWFLELIVRDSEKQTKDQGISSVTMNAGKAVVRGVKNYAKGYSDIQVKVSKDFIDIMEMLDKRLNDKGKHWRHVYKVIKYAKENLYVVKTLKEFQFVEDDGKDHGINVRQLSKDITALLADDSRLQMERRDPSSRRSNDYDAPLGPASSGPAREYYNEETDLEKALEESKRTARLEERKRTDAQRSESDLQKALELSEREAAEENARQSVSAAKSKPNDMIDFFASTEESQPNLLANSYQSTNFTTPFGGFSSPQSSFAAPAPDPFVALMQQQQIQQQQLQQQIAQQQLQQSFFSAPASQPAANPFAGFGPGQTGLSTSTSTGSLSNVLSNGQNTGVFFDNVPRKIAPQQIDPFASLAGGGRSNQYGIEVFGILH
ncbi:hypothetical protein HDU67_007357 [Dinochytrium kinnereticum]|nr:hypothetical protein HDU67_007357 [Dinochytrium kinnereticum]